MPAPTETAPGGRAADATGTGARLIRLRPSWTLLALAAGLAVQLLPVLFFPTVLSQDGPAHVDGAWVLDHYGDAGPVGAVLRDQYRLNLAPVPNMFAELLLAVLARIVDADAAERLAVGCSLVALTLAMAYAARGVDRRAGWLAVVALPLCGSYLVAYGFYDYLWGVVGALLVVGFVLRRRDGWSRRATAGLAVLVTCTWFAHLLPCAVALVAAGVLALARVGEERFSGAALGSAVRRQLVPVLVAAVPAVALTLRYVLSAAGRAGAPAGFATPLRALSLLSGMRPFAVGSGAELWPVVVVAAGLLIGVGAACQRRGPRGPRADRVAVGLLLVVLTAAAVATPGRLGVQFGFLADRLAWFPPLLAALWIATRLPGRRLAPVLFSLVLAGATAAALVRLPAEKAASRSTQELLSVASDVPRGATLVVLDYLSTGQPATPLTGLPPDPLRHESSRLAAHAGAVDIGHYEADTPYFQLTFRGGPEVRRRIETGGLERVPPQVDLSAAGGELDTVVLVGLRQAPPGVRTAPATKAVLAELAAHYRLVATSSPTGLAEVWRFVPGAG